MPCMRNQRRRPLTRRMTSFIIAKFMLNISQNQFEKIIRAHHGHSYRTADMLFGFFPDSRAAKAAAAAIASAGVSVMVCGSQIMMVL